MEEITFKYNPETKVEVILSISKKAKVHQDAIAYIGTEGVIGQSFVGLTPGSANTPFLKNGGIVASEDPIEAREFMKIYGKEFTEKHSVETKGDISIVVKFNPMMENGDTDKLPTT